ncbi:hypothetical protein H312_00039 [Anncaliia algerae PRA339]|uniref:Uncharacterized protein n=1 Tax=Anncaliia algerae PRA339 TaxID=1288291 RepID=A0A059F5X5_9MICR|nr:hypothetical protein H312_00039 [Anncaliia algerae PRA339]
MMTSVIHLLNNSLPNPSRPSNKAILSLLFSFYPSFDALTKLSLSLHLLIKLLYCLSMCIYSFNHEGACISGNILLDLFNRRSFFLINLLKKNLSLTKQIL